MEAIAGLVYVAAALLALAGGAKIARPIPTAGALRALHLPGPLLGVRLLGAGEIALAVAAVVTGAAPLLALLGLAYVAFAIFVVAALRAGTNLQSCGCFGTVDTPPSLVHVVLDLGLAVACGIAAVRSPASLAATLADQPWSGVPFVLLLVVTVYLAYVALTLLPLTLRAGRA